MASDEGCWLHRKYGETSVSHPFPPLPSHLRSETPRSLAPHAVSIGPEW